MLKKYWKKTKELFQNNKVEEEIKLPTVDDNRHYLPLPQEVCSIYGITQAHRREEEEEDLEYPILPQYQDQAKQEIGLARAILKAAEKQDASFKAFDFDEKDIVFQGYRDHYLFQRERGIYRTNWVPATHMVEKVYTSMGNLSRNPYQMVFYLRTRHGFEGDRYCRQMLSGRIFYTRSGAIQSMELLQELAERSQCIRAKFQDGQIAAIDIKDCETAPL